MLQLGTVDRRCLHPPVTRPASLGSVCAREPGQSNGRLGHESVLGETELPIEQANDAQGADSSPAPTHVQRDQEAHGRHSRQHRQDRQTLRPSYEFSI